MIWNFTLMLLHAAALAGFIYLYKSAPCWMQKVSMAGFITATGFLTIGFGMALGEVWWHWYVVLLGLTIEHLAVLVYVFRLLYQQHLEWKPSSIPSRSL